MFKSLKIATCLLFSGSVMAQDECAHWYDFSTLGATDMFIEGAPSYSEINIQAQLIYRPLIQDDEFYWLGFQLYNPSISLNDEDLLEPIYSVPFAVKLDKDQNNIHDFIFNAELKFEDQSKLTGIYETLHIRKPYSGSDPNNYIVESDDDLGTYEVQYQVDSNQVIKSRIQYKKLGMTASQNAAVEISEAIIHGDETRFTRNLCWHENVEGTSHIEVRSADDFIRVIVKQQLDVVLREDPLPLDARLLQLPLNPTLWEPIPEEEVYPKAKRRPESSGEEFLRKLGLLDLENMSSKDILQYLYDNDEYLPLLKGPLWSNLFADKAEQRLFLMVGKTDSANAHWLLTEIYVDETFDGDARFRSLMALKYAENPISADLVEQIFAYSMQPLDGENADLASSAMLIMGAIAKNQLDEDFGRYLSDRIATELRGNSDPQQSASLITAIGNSGDLEQQYVVENYLTSDNSILRQRSAEALAHLPNDRSRDILSQQLMTENNTRVQAAMIEGMGASQLNGAQIAQVYDYAAGSPETDVRRAAIKALTNQVESTPEVSQQLRELLKTEKNRSNLQEILRTLY